MTEEIKNLDSRSVEGVSLEELERDLDNQVLKTLHKCHKTVSKKYQQTFQYGPEGRIVATFSVSKNSRARK